MVLNYLYLCHKYILNWYTNENFLHLNVTYQVNMYMEHEMHGLNPGLQKYHFEARAKIYRHDPDSILQSLKPDYSGISRALSREWCLDSPDQQQPRFSMQAK